MFEISLTNNLKVYLLIFPKFMVSNSAIMLVNKSDKEFLLIWGIPCIVLLSFCKVFSLLHSCLILAIICAFKSPISYIPSEVPKIIRIELILLLNVDEIVDEIALTSSLNDLLQFIDFYPVGKAKVKS